MTAGPGFRLPAALMILRPLAFTALALSLIACGDEPKNNSTSSGDPPEDPGPSAAVKLEIYATEAQDCPPGNVLIDLGNVSSAPPVTFEDGKDGSAVACSVVPESGKLLASGSITRDATSFAFRDVLTDGASAIGHVSFKDPESGAIYATPDGKPCVFQFAPGSGQAIEAGRIFVQFDCSNLVSEADPTKACSGRNGYLLFEHCEGEPEGP